VKKEQIDVTGATLPFFRYEENGITYYEFDSSESELPVPMVNALRGLELLKDRNERLKMINMQEPTGLYPSIAERFSWSTEVLEDGNVSILFCIRE